ncbi:unnamed protein product [Urochloa humidicola]
METPSSPPHPSSPPALPFNLDATTSPTSLTLVLTPSPAATASSPPPASSLLQDIEAGRNKALRWSRDTPPTGKSGDSSPPPSYKEALLSKIPMPPSGQYSSLVVNSPRPAPRFVLRVVDSWPPPPKRGPNTEGWQQAESKRSRKARLRATRRPHRRVPADLRGLCFNCLSPNHRAAAFYSKTHCFKCRRLGHRALRCPGFSSSGRQQCKMVWHRKEVGRAAGHGSDGIGGSATSIPPPADGAVASDHSPGGAALSGVRNPDGGGRRRRRRTRRRRGAGPSEGTGLPANSDAPVMAVPMALALGVSATPRPRWIIDRSTRIGRAEEELHYALTVLMVGDPSAVSVDGLVAELARRYDLPAGALVIHRMSPNELMLKFSTEADAVHIYDNERPIQLPHVTLHYRCWTWFENASSRMLPNLIDIELRGVPQHVWELETAEHLLDEWC